jgi:tetratricopeptide (TPR) repeat protein
VAKRSQGEGVPTLQVLLGGRLVTTVELQDVDLRLGCAAENDVVLENDGSSVSRFHAELRRTAEGYQLVNLSQVFGLEVGGRRVERAPLGDTPVRLGPYELKLVRAETGAGAADGPAAVRRERPSQAVTLRIPRPAPFVAAAGSPAPPARPGEMLAAAAADGPPSVAPTPAAITPMAPTRVGATGPPRSRRLAGWLTLAAVAAGLVAIVAIGQLIAPTAVSRPEPVSATAPDAPPAGAPTGDATSAVTLHLSAAREALARGRYEEVLEPHVAAILGEDPTHADALSLKQEAEAGLARARAAATDAAQAKATSAAATASPAASASPAAAGGHRPILRKPGGPQTSFPGRDRDVVRRYLQAIDAAKTGEYRLAVSNLNSVLRSDPTFPGAEEQLEEIKGRVRTMAEDKFAEAARLEGDGQYRAALAAYQRSTDIAVMMYGEMVGAAEAMSRVRGAMAAAGVDAFKRARQFDALGRPGEAAPMYARALELLPDDDPNRQVAQERLAALRKQ